MLEGLGRDLRRRFFTGLLLVTPLAITIFFIKFLFNLMDGLLGPVITRILGIHIPGLGVISTLVIIFLAGITCTNFIGRRLVQRGEALLARLPIVKTIYLGSKQLIEGAALPERKSFKQVVLVEWPSKSSQAIGFVTNTVNMEMGHGEKREVLAVFIPTTPIPATGFTLFLNQEEVVPLPYTVEEGIQIVISGGIAIPKT